MTYNGTTYLSVTKYTCDLGYEFAGRNETLVISRKCLENGTWTGEQPSCQRKDCHNLTDPDYGNVTFNSTLYEAEATYTCHAGYVFTGTNTSLSISRKCLDNGTWAGKPPVCTPQDCGGLKNPDDGNVTTNDTTYGSTTTYTCNVGYIISGTNDKQTTRKCLQDGKWSEPIPTCSIRDCGSLSSPANGHTNYNKTTYGATANYTCNPGYKFNNTNDSVISRKCSPNGAWTGFQPVCEIKDCGTHTSLTHGQVVSENGTKYNDLISYSCDNGYEVNTTKTSITIRCSESGLWEPNINECKDIDECNRKAHNCHYWANCKNINGSYGCECRKGFYDVNPSNPGRLCKDVDECQDATACFANGTRSCVNAIGIYICVCHSGYKGDRCETDINECQTIGCGVNALCTNHPGSYSCQCNETFPSGNPHIHCYENTLIKFEPSVAPRRGHNVRTPTENVAFRYTYYGVQHHIFRAYQDGFISLGFQPVFDHQAPPSPDKWRDSSKHNYGYDSVAILAPLWFYLDSVNISNSGLYVHSFSADETGNVTDHYAVKAMEIAKIAFGAYINDTTFEPKVVIEATWVNMTVAYSGVTPILSVQRENVTMQVILVSDGISTYFMFNYAQEAWTIQPKDRRDGAVGYSKPDFSGNILANNVNFTRMTNFSTNSPLNGRHIFNVTQGTPAQMEFLQVEEDCRRYYYNTSARACLKGKRKHAYSCPCQQMFVQYEITLHEVTAQEALLHAESYPNKTACFQEWFSNYYGVKQTCCYEFGALAKDMPMGGLPLFDNDECGSLAAYKTCCIKSHRLCHLYYEMNPPDDCTHYRPPVIG